MLAFHVHDLSSTLWASETNPLFALRWYGLSYLVGFTLGWFLIRWLAYKGRTTTPMHRVSDLIFAVALFGVFIGGRLGYMLFYTDGAFFRNPKMFFDFLGGGMASHGGIIGIMVATLFFAWKNKLPWTGVGDDVVVAAPLGLLSGRLANYVNGELWGRPTDVSWAVKFPTEVRDNRMGLDDEAFKALTTWTDAKGGGHYLDSDKLLENAERMGLYDEVLAAVPARHPSQLYEAATEGLLLFLILLAVRLRWRTLGHGILTGLFFILYAVFRIFCELYREPDASLFYGFTRGQFYSFFMIVIGLGFLWWGFRGGGRRTRDAQPSGAST